MDVNQVLTNTLSPDAATRGNAEQQLQQAAQQNFSEYLSVLSRELANENADPSIRQAAGLALKNAFTYRDVARLREVQARWLQTVDPNIKKQVKELALQTFNSPSMASSSAAQLVATIAAIELPRNEWPELMPLLVNNVGSGPERTKMSSLTTIGFICESEDADLREALVMHSNAILTAVVQGARKEESNQDVRNAALAALSDATEFIRSNFENEGERNYIMQVVCEATQSEDPRVQAGAFGCLNRIMGIYYDKMRFYMEKALFGLTIAGMKSEEEDVAKLAIEFWCTVCEEEISIEDDNTQAQQEGSNELRPYFNFARVAAREVIPHVLDLMSKVEEDDADDEYNVARAAYQCLQLYAQTIGSELVPMVLQFVEANLRAEDWRKRDAAVASFGAIMDGPETKVLDPLVKQALPVLIGMMQDPSLQVRDSAAYALSRICDYCYESIDTSAHLQPLMQALFQGLMSNPKMASSCCLALLNLAERLVSEDGSDTNPLTPHFKDSVTALLQVTEKADSKEDGANQVRTAAYEVLGGFITNAANQSLGMVNDLTGVIIDRLSQSLSQAKDVVSIEDKLNLEEKQISLSSVLLTIVQRLEQHIAGQSDHIMQICIEMLNATGNTAVPEVIFQIVSGLCNALNGDFLKYMESFVPYLNAALRNQEAPDMCSLGIGLVSDIVRALEDKAQPFCDQFMNDLLNNLRSDKITNQLKPPILETFGDIASNIGPAFETYLTVVAQVLTQASQVTVANDVSYDMIDYIVSLRSGIADAWDGIIVAFKGTQRVNLLQGYAQPIFQFLQTVAADVNHNEGLLRACMGIVGDLGEAFPDGQLADFFRAEWLTKLIKETRSTREFSNRTITAARWARETVKRQSAHQGNLMNAS
ncbi:karyopherin Kap95 [Exophiala xenobiotica]|uniref:Karyopherin Kap95 n=1 Tax=Lithohypha guttulata TaxID=1690604 RepID=A0ABR0K0T6_9EURO|nr:karyopherin Kap95 [Lithohypha guttulata]KAK5325258.1 karyopherin Kap95 [Exophiala xenobiotica]